MNKVLQTEKDLKKQLENQLLLLGVLADSYDKGNFIVAKSIATAIRVLVHDTNKSHSLLDQLGLKNKYFFDSCSNLDIEKSLKNKKIGNTIRVGSFCGLVGVAGNKFIPYLDDVINCFGFVKFDEYWNRIVFIDSHKKIFTRKDIVLFVSNQDGGAHVDPKIDNDYKKLTKENSLGWKFSQDGKIWKNSQEPELATIRQIGHEILKSLLSDYPYKKIILHGEKFLIGGMGFSLVPSKNKKVDNNMPIVGRNKRCPCGSGVKYKKCHGK